MFIRTSIFTLVFNMRCAIAESRFLSGIKVWGNDDLDDCCYDCSDEDYGGGDDIMILCWRFIVNFFLSIPKATPEILCGPYCTRGEIMAGIIKY